MNPSIAPRVLHSLGLAAAAVLLAACASSAGIAPQAAIESGAELASPQTLASLSSERHDWPAADWWTRYGDPQLDRLVAEAVFGSPSLRAAEARLRQAAALAGNAQAALYPRIDASVRSSRQLSSKHGGAPKAGAGSWSGNHEATLGLSYEIDFWKKNEAGFEASLGRARAARAEVNAAHLVLVVGVTQTYLRLSQMYAQQDLAREVLAQRLHVLQLTKQRVEARIDAQTDLRQAEYGVYAAEEQIVAVDEAIVLTRGQLAALAGKGPERAAAIGRPRLGTVRAAGVPTLLSSDLIARRPDVTAQRWRVEAFGHDIRQARAQFYPSVNLVSLVGLQSVGIGQFFEAGSRIAGAGAGVTLPLFDAGRLRANLALRSAEYDAAVEQYNQTVVDAMRDVVSQLVSIRALDERAALQRKALGAAEQGYDMALARYKAGTGSYLQVLAAQTQVLTARHAQIELDSRALELDINLVRALGGGYAGGQPALAAASANHGRKQ